MRIIARCLLPHAAGITVRYGKCECQVNAGHLAVSRVFCKLMLSVSRRKEGRKCARRKIVAGSNSWQTLVITVRCGSGGPPSVLDGGLRHGQMQYNGERWSIMVLVGVRGIRRCAVQHDVD